MNNYSKKLTMAIKNYDIEDLLQFLDEEVKPIYKENLKCGGFSGWHHSIYFTEDGKFEISGAMSCGTTTMNAHEGKEIQVASIDANPTLEIEGIIEYQTTEEEKNIIIQELKKLGEYETYEELDNDEENLREKGEEYFIKLFPTRYKEIEELFINSYWEQEEEMLIETIQRNLKQEEDYIDMY